MNCTYKINKYKFSLFDIIDQICLNTIFYANFCFLFEKLKKNYNWVIEKSLKFLFHMIEIFDFNVFVIDKKLTLIKFLKISYSRARTFFCL